MRKHASSRTSDNFKVYPSARKVTVSVFWDAEAVICLSVSRAIRWMGHAATDACGYWQGERPAHATTLEPPTEHKTIHRNVWTIHATGPNLESSIPSFVWATKNNWQKADSTIKRKWKGFSWMVANAKSVFICHDRNFKLVPRCDKFNNVPGD